MKNVKAYISRNWLWIIAGLLLTVVSVRMAYAERGYIAYGGEYLTLPLVLMIVEVFRSVCGAIGCLFGKGDGYGSDED